LKDKEKEEKMRERSPQPRHRLGASMGSAEPVSPRSSGASPLDPPSPRALPPHKSPGTVKKVQSIPRNSRRKSSEQISMSADTLQIEVNSVVLPATPIMSPQRKLSTQPRRLSRVNPKDVKRLYEGKESIFYDFFAIFVLMHCLFSQVLLLAFRWRIKCLLGTMSL
jgi:hypothetical protein